MEQTLPGTDRPAPWHHRLDEHREKWLAALGGVTGIAVTAAIGAQAESLPIVASMGASAVLLFAAPHTRFATPWSLLGGHLVSALIGVACSHAGLPPTAGGALAVGLAILAMHYLHCLHPPGGATALFAVLGAPAGAAMGWSYVLYPIALNALALFACAVIFNRLLRPPPEPVAAAPAEKCVINHSDLVYAISRIPDFLDVEEEELVRIYRLAMRHHEQPEGNGEGAT
ncbi:HPP family protein [Endothiovibrio diazotrophicus]